MLKERSHELSYALFSLFLSLSNLLLLGQLLVDLHELLILSLETLGDLVCGLRDQECFPYHLLGIVIFRHALHGDSFKPLAIEVDVKGLRIVSPILSVFSKDVKEATALT